MRLLKRWLVAGVFMGVTLGMGFPYAVAYQQWTSTKLSCHCCDGGHVDCHHCAKFGHRASHKKGTNDVTDPFFERAPCKRQQEPASSDFSTNRFLVVKFMVGGPLMGTYLVMDKDHSLIRWVPQVPLPPPRFA